MLDRTIFLLDKAERLDELKKQCDYYQRPPSQSRSAEHYPLGCENGHHEVRYTCGEKKGSRSGTCPLVRHPLTALLFSITGHSSTLSLSRLPFIITQPRFASGLHCPLQTNMLLTRSNRRSRSWLGGFGIHHTAGCRRGGRRTENLCGYFTLVLGESEAVCCSAYGVHAVTA